MKTVPGRSKPMSAELLRTLPSANATLEQTFDDFLLIAAQICRAPIAGFKLADEAGEWERTNVELTTAERFQLDLFQSYVLTQTEPIIVNDSQEDNRFEDSSARSLDKEFRFYAGIPILLDEGNVFGSICVLGRIPGELGLVQLNALRALQRQIISQIQLHRRYTMSANSNHALDVEVAEHIRVESVPNGSDSRYQQISANAPGMVYQFALHPDGTMSLPFVSEGSRDVCGIDPEDIVSNPGLLIDNVHPEERSEFFRSIAESAAQLTPWKWEGRVTLPTGELRWVQAASRPEKQENGDILWNGVVMDLTRVKREQEARRESEVRYRLVTETASDCIVTVDRDSHVLFVNAAVEEIFGYTPDEVTGAELTMFVPDYVRPSCSVSSDSDTCTGGTDIPRAAVELSGLHKSGYTFPIEISSGEYCNNGKHFTTCIIRNITERKRVEEELRKSNREIATIFESINDAFFALDTEWRFKYLNTEAERLLGRSRNELLGRPIWSEFPESPGSTLCSGFSKASSEGVRAEFEEFYQPKNKWFNIRVYPSASGLSIYFQDIDERKRLEAAMRQSEEYRRLFELARDAILIFDLQSEIVLEMNDKACEVYGLPREEFIGLSLDSLLGNTAENSGQLKNLLSKGQEHSFESIQHGSDGTPLYFLINLSLIDFQGRQAVLSINHNITARRTAEEAQRLSEKRFRGAFDLAPIGMAMVGPDGRFMQVNRSLCGIVGYSEDELLELDFQTITHIDDLELDLEYVRKMLSGEITYYQMEKHYVHRDGQIVPVLLCVSLVRDDEGLPLYFISQIQNITERKQAEESLRDSDERYRLLFNRNPLPSWVFDLETLQFLNVNDAAIEHYGYSREEFLAMTIEDIRPPEYLPALRERVAAVRARTMVASELWKHRKKDNTIIDVEIASHRLTYGGKSAVLIMVNDVTERSRSEEALRQSEEQLRQSQKMESIGTLAGGVAHDFNNLLTAILGNTQLAMRMTEEGGRLHSRLKEVLKSGNRATTLTRQLLAFSRRQHLERKNIDLNETIADTMKMLQRIIGEDVEVQINMTPNLPLIFADPSQVAQVVMNLAVNARDAMPEGGRLLIETEKVNFDETYMRNHPDAKDQKYVRLMMSDSGVGMTPETRDRIFEPFFTTKDVGRGTGLGLSMVYGIVKQHEGSIEVYSEVGCGTVFKVYWPIAVSNIEAEEPEIKIIVRGGTETILLAEDEEDLRELARDVLEDLGYTVLVACDGLEAVEIFDSNKNRIDLVMLDVVMPRMNGSEAYTQMLTSHPNLPAVFLTGYSTAMMHFKIAEGTSAVLIQKPYSVESLGLKVREILDRVRERVM